MKHINKPNYPEESAGAICVSDIPTVPPGTRGGDVHHVLSQQNTEFASMDYVYVVEVEGRLVGVVALHEVFSRDPEVPVDEYMQCKIISVNPDDDQEKVVAVALENNLKSVPVVDGGVMLGVVPPHTILQILHEEHVEDLMKEAGVVQRSLGPGANPITQIKSRLPWLIYGTIGGLLAAGIVRFFEGALGDQLLLAAFIPTVVYLADAVGNQVQTIYVRAHALGLSSRLLSSMRRELVVVSSLGLLISFILLAAITIWLNEPVVALVVGTAVFISVVFAGLIAVIMPWLFIKLGYDPAVSSGPLATITLDISSIIIYFLVAEYLLGIYAS